jgi:hypothetical protein
VGQRWIWRQTYFLSGDQMLSQKLLVNGGVDTFAGGNWPSAA